MTDPPNANIVGHYQCKAVFARSIVQYQCPTLDDARAKLAHLQAANAEQGLPATHKAQARLITGPGLQLAEEVVDLLKPPAPVELQG